MKWMVFIGSSVGILLEVFFILVLFGAFTVKILALLMYFYQPINLSTEGKVQVYPERR